MQSVTFDVRKLRDQFPILRTPGLVYLDNAATSQKPQAVIQAIQRYYESQNANVHRAVHRLSEIATAAYEQARRKIAHFINAYEPAEVIFTRGATEAINLVSHSYGLAFLKTGDEIIISTLEHHSNIVPWQMVCQHTGAVLRVIPIDDAGELLMDEYARLLGPRTRLVAVTQVSNALGTINDVRRITQMAHEAGARVLIDGAQWIAHHPTDVRDIGCDFYVFSGHKVFGPTGIGVLWGRRELLEQMPPYQGGGDMIESVSFQKTTYAPLPNKFEAGTPHIAGAIGLGAAVDFVQSIGFANFIPHEQRLLAYATEKLSQIPGLKIIGTAREKSGVISFVINDPPIATFDIGTLLDRQGVAIRTGHHCCQPLMARLGLSATARVSLALYNTQEDIDALVAALKKIIAEHGVRRAVPVASAAELVFPVAAGPSPAAVADELAKLFDQLPERDAKSQLVLDMGKKLPACFHVLKNLTQQLQGCMSQVYLLSRRSPGSRDRFEFVADSDADFVRGEIAILQKLYSGQRARDVVDFEIESFFRRIGLEQFVSSQRRNGLASMVRRIRADAAAILQDSSA